MKKLCFAALAALALACTPASAQTFPTRPIHVIVPIGPGGGYHLTGRLLAEGMHIALVSGLVKDLPFNCSR